MKQFNDGQQELLIYATAPGVDGVHVKGDIKGNAKVGGKKDLAKIIEFFCYTIGTTRDAALATGVPRQSITRYVQYLEGQGLLRVVCVKPDRGTGRRAKHYSGDPAVWARMPRVLSIFAEEELL